MEIAARRPQDLSPAERAAWAALHRSEPHLRHPSLGPAFALATAETFATAEVGVVTDRGEPVGFLPFDRGPGDVGRPLVPSLTDRQAFLARPGLPVDAADLLRGCGLAAWRFDHFAPAPRPGPFAPHVAERDDAYEVDLTGGFDAYVARGGVASFVRQTERKARKLAREVGPVRFEWRVEDDALLDRLVQFKRAQLAEHGLRDPFGDPALIDLIRRLHRTHLPADDRAADDPTADETAGGAAAGGPAAGGPAFAGALSVLWAGEEAVALHMGLWAGEEFHSWIPTHCGERRRYSPGAVLHLELLRAAAARGVRTVDLGRGGNALKRRLANRTRPLGIGAVDLRPWGRAAAAARRAFAAAPLARRTVRALRRLRARPAA